MPEDAPMPATISAKSNADAVTDTEFSVSGDLSGGDGGVIKEILAHGTQGWVKPEDGDEVQMHYRGTLLDGGDEFDTSYARGLPFKFKLGEGKVIKGWDIIGKTMAKGERARVTLKPEYAYGSTGSPPKIPANSTLVFEMELVSWTSQRDVFGDGTVMRTEIESGDGWERPGKLAEVSLGVKLVEMKGDGDGEGGTDGKVLFEDGEFIGTLGAGQMPEPWERIIPDMKRNATVELVCKAPRLLGVGLEKVVLGDGVTSVKHVVTLSSWRKIEDVAGDGSVMKKLLSEGDGWERPGEGAIAVVDMSVFVPDDTSSQVVPPAKQGVGALSVQTGFEFKVGDGIVVDGLDRVVQSMKLKERSMVYLSPAMAYQTAPSLLTEDLRKGGLSLTSSVLVELTLSSFEKAQDVWGMSTEEKLKEMVVRKTRGNELFKDKRYETARKSYQRAISFFDSSTADLDAQVKQDVNDLLVSCHLNMAMCFDRSGDMIQSLSHCKKALEIQPSNVKALYRQGCAYLELDDFYNAQSSLKYAKELAPGNGDVVRKLKDLKNKRLKQDAQDKKLFSNLFGRMSKMEDKEKKGDEAEGSEGNDQQEEEQKMELQNGNGKENGSCQAEKDQMEVDACKNKGKDQDSNAAVGPLAPPGSATKKKSTCDRGCCG